MRFARLFPYVGILATILRHGVFRPHAGRDHSGYLSHIVKRMPDNSCDRAVRSFRGDGFDFIPAARTPAMINSSAAAMSHRETDEVIRILLVDDHVIFRAAIRTILTMQSDMLVVAEASDGIEALEMIRKHEPRVVVMDLEMPGGDGTVATVAISRLANPPLVVVLTMHSEEESLVPLLKSGASGFLSKDAQPDELLRAIRVVAGGDMYVRPRAASLLASRIHSPPHDSSFEAARSKMAKLSEREREVLLQMARGYNGPEIGTRIGISPKTVETYKRRIAEKIGLEHRSDYVSFALTTGLMSCPDRGRN
jgi:Response regulator containing a CheY-like receiver domain and an HTH DNA-binding domain